MVKIFNLRKSLKCGSYFFSPYKSIKNKSKFPESPHNQYIIYFNVYSYVINAHLLPFNRCGDSRKL